MVFRHPDTSTSLPPWNSPHNPVKPEMRSGDMGPSLSVPRPVLNASLHCNWQACTSSLPDGRFTVKSAELRLQPIGNSLDMAICDHSEHKRGPGLYRKMMQGLQQAASKPWLKQCSSNKHAASHLHVSEINNFNRLKPDDDSSSGLIVFVASHLSMTLSLLIPE